jgi:hypothetical protein
MRALVLAALPCVLAAQGETLTTRQDQRGLAVTIYNDNLALVKDTREVHLPKGLLDLAFQEVSAQIRPETALLRNLSDPADFWIAEQNFDFDLLTPAKLLEKYVGRKVTVVTTRPNPDGPGAREVREEAEVLATNEGVVLRFPDRIETAPSGRIVFPAVPANLRARPTLVVSLHSPRDKAQKLELSYLTGGLSWKADYVASLAPDEKTLDLSGWVTLTNQSGAAYPDATLQLVAGDVHRAPARKGAPMNLMAAGMAAERARAPEMQEQSLFEYHLYTLDRPTSLKENQTKQVALLTAQGVPVAKEYVLRGDASFYQTRVEEFGTRNKVGVFIQFENREASRMGMPLPRGVVRVYKRDAQGRPQFVGEDTVDHTPKNETVRLKLGEAFDVTALRKQTDFTSLGTVAGFKHTYETAFQVDLRNAKKESVTVSVVEPIFGDWEIVQKSHPFTKETSGAAKFLVPVPAEGSATLTYRVRMHW